MRTQRPSLTNDVSDVPLKDRCGKPNEYQFRREDTHMQYENLFGEFEESAKTFIDSFAVSRDFFWSFFYPSDRSAHPSIPVNDVIASEHFYHRSKPRDLSLSVKFEQNMAARWEASTPDLEDSSSGADDDNYQTPASTPIAHYSAYPHTTDAKCGKRKRAMSSQDPSDCLLRPERSQFHSPEDSKSQH